MSFLTLFFQLHKCVFRTFRFFSHGNSLTYLYTSFSFLVDQPVAFFYKCYVFDGIAVFLGEGQEGSTCNGVLKA